NGLDEYDGDYTSFEKLGDIVTADMRHQMELEANKKLEREAREIAEAETTPDEQDQDSDLDQAPSIAAEEQSLEEIEDEPDLEGDEIPDQPVEKKLENNE
ncbi:MAG: hypothetical protein IH811_10945, partial [Proteobacteria bacterium]|nr:hypothetical protein [Pseudomonadota bacterium]